MHLQYVASQENQEELYLMFSQLLDRKLREMKADPQVREEESDIEDDYMQEIIGTGHGVSTSNIAEVRYIREERSMFNWEHHSVLKKHCDPYFLKKNFRQSKIGVILEYTSP